MHWRFLDRRKLDTGNDTWSKSREQSRPDKVREISRPHDGIDERSAELEIALLVLSHANRHLASLQKTVNGECEKLLPGDSYPDIYAHDSNGHYDIVKETESYARLTQVFDLEGKLIADDVSLFEDEHVVQDYLFDENRQFAR
jgi:hypothetical protein